MHANWNLLSAKASATCYLNMHDRAEVGEMQRKARALDRARLDRYTDWKETLPWLGFFIFTFPFFGRGSDEVGIRKPNRTPPNLRRA